MSYDRNGNISSIFRSGFPSGDYEIAIDNLQYTNQGNQLAKVSDTSNNTAGFSDGNTIGDDYSYDANGNMTIDKNKGIITPITYNHLNLPTKITFSTAPTGNIDYIYNANGIKVQKTVVMLPQKSSTITTRTITNYLTGFQYNTIVQSSPVMRFKQPTTQLQFVPTAEGYYDFVKNGYVYNYTDHLGNVRLSYQDINKDGVVANSEILEESNYYPFGMKHSGYNSGNLQPNYKYKYNGKELQDELGLNFYDYGARNYDPALGRWMNVDPLAEKLPFASPYAYCLNNPIVMVDPDGQYPWPFWVRSFISSSTAGGGTFRGDGRGASTSMDVTSRVNYNFTYDGQNRTVSQGAFYSDFTLKYPQSLPGGGMIPAMVKTSTPRKSVDNMQNLTDRNGEALDTYGFHYWAKDPITPQFATPALDVHGYLQLNEDLDKGVLSIWGYFKGDTFPSTEAFVVDQSGNKLFIGAHKEQGTVLTLVGDSQTPIFNFDMQVKFDNKGNFTGVIQGDKTISVENWNKQTQEGFNK